MARVLVADDNPLSLAFLVDAIARCGHVADKARDGMEACLLASAQHYDLMIIDARMPLRTGAETLRVIRAGDGPSSRSIAIATSADIGLDSEVLLMAGFSSVAFKPIAIESLRALLDAHLWVASTPLLDDGHSLEKLAGNHEILASLRKLLARELDALPDEVSACTASADAKALGDRLHKLDASAGFCGAIALARASRELRQALDADDGWPSSAISAFLHASAQTRSLLD